MQASISNLRNLEEFDSAALNLELFWPEIHNLSWMTVIPKKSCEIVAKKPRVKLMTGLCIWNIKVNENREFQLYSKNQIKKHD